VFKVDKENLVYHNIEIKRYCNKKIFFIQYFFPCVNWKYLFLDNHAYWNLVWKDFKMSLQHFEEKNIFIKMSHLFIAILHCVQKYLCDVGLDDVTFRNGWQLFRIKNNNLSKSIETFIYIFNAFFCSINMFSYTAMGGPLYWWFWKNERKLLFNPTEY